MPHPVKPEYQESLGSLYLVIVLVKVVVVFLLVDLDVFLLVENVVVVFRDVVALVVHDVVHEVEVLADVESLVV